MTTARDICTLALKEAGVLGVGQTALAEDINDSYTLLRRMMAGWQRKRWMIPNLTDISLQLTGAQTYTIGPGGDFDYPVRPSEIKAGYIIQNTIGPYPVSMPLKPIFAFEDWAYQIAVKTLPSLPYLFFYENNRDANNRGTIHIWPIGDSQYTAHLIIPAEIAFPNTADGLNSEFNLPEEYEEAIHYNLALRLISMYQTQATKLQIALAKSGRELIRQNNTQVPVMTMPAGLTPGRAFNIWNADGF
jgi:hypothetical protein